MRVRLQGGVGAGDDGKRIGYCREIFAAKDEVHFAFAESGVDAIADASEAENRAVGE